LIINWKDYVGLQEIPPDPNPDELKVYFLTQEIQNWHFYTLG